MLAEWLASLFFRGDRDRPPVRTLTTGSVDDAEREEQEQDLGRSWDGPAAAGDPTEQSGGRTEHLDRERFF